MKIVYLDQNHWIRLAQAYHRRSRDSQLVAAFEMLGEGVKNSAVALPLSAIHYMETARVTDQRRRARLGVVMWALSRGLTIASYRSILTYELETALAKRRSRVHPRPFTLVSQGVAHAFGMEVAPFRLRDEIRAALPEQLAQSLEEVGNTAMERALLTGEGPPGVEMLTFGMTKHNHRFQEHLRTLHPRLSQLSPNLWEDALYAISIVDILDPLNEVMAYHGLYTYDVASSREEFRSLLDDLPSRRVDIQLHRQVLRNPALRPKKNDLEDWGALGPAAAHCDFLVCEKHFASLLLRDGFKPRAAVLTDVRSLPEALDV